MLQHFIVRSTFPQSVALTKVKVTMPKVCMCDIILHEER